MQIELRDYQEESIKRILAAYEQQPRGGKELLVIPTGGGKTIVFSQVIDALNQRYGINSLVIAHRDELLDQAADKYRMVKPQAVIGKVGSGFHQYGGEVTVASIATISRPEHLKRLKAIGYGLVITDEAHHSQAESYQKVYEALPDAFHLFVTATPDRLDGKPLLDGKKPIYETSILEMIERGYLCNVRAVAIKTDIDLSTLHTRMGDYTLDELDLAVNTEKRNRRVVDAYLEHAADRRAICFAVTVEHARNLAETFNRAGVAAALVSGDTPLEERKRLYRGLRDGSISVLTNVQVLTEGFDMPQVDCIIMARPTQSRALYVQSIGRGLRTAPAKQDCLILDLTDNCLKHRLEAQSLRKILGKQLRDGEGVIEALAREQEEAEIGKKSAMERVHKLKDVRGKDLQIDLLAKLDWTAKENGMFVLEVGPEKHRIALVPSGNDDGYYSIWARLAPLYQAQRWLENAPLDWAQGHAEKQARKLLADPKASKLVDRDAPWRQYSATEVQLEKLAKWQSRFGLVYDPETVTRGEASDMLDKVYEHFEEQRQKRQQKGIAV